MSQYSNRKDAPGTGRSIKHTRIEDQKQIKEVYEFGENLGKGGSFGVVKEAKHFESDKRWAIKAIKKEKAGSSAVKLLEREVLIMKRIEHVHLIHLEEIYETSKRMYLVMELGDAGGLEKLLERKKRFTEKEIWTVIKQLASAVAYLHDCDQFGMIGLLTFIWAAETEPNLVTLALGSDLTTLGLNLNSADCDSTSCHWPKILCRLDSKLPGQQSTKPQREIQTSPSGMITNIPKGMVRDQFGMKGLLPFFRAAETEPNLVTLALGRQQVEELPKNLKKKFRKLINEISLCDEQDVTQEQLKHMWARIRESQPNDDWKAAFKRLPYDQRVHHLYQMCRVYMRLEEHIKRYSGKSFIDVTLIAHGGFRSPMRSGSLHYMNPYLEKITLYEPWGCAIDASVVYGIATGLINTHNVRYTDRVIPSFPTCWNDLSRNTTIPEVYFSYVKTDEVACRRLMALFNRFRDEARGVVIPFFQSPFETGVPEHPLWAVSNAIALVGYCLDVKIKLHIAACLTTEDRSLLHHHSNNTYIVNFNQYGSVPVKLPSPPCTPTVMTCHLPGIPNGMDVLSCWLIQ